MPLIPKIGLRFGGFLSDGRNRNSSFSIPSDFIDFYTRQAVGEKYRTVLERDAVIETLYSSSSIIYACSRVLVDGAADVPLLIKNTRTNEKTTEHPALDLLNSPSASVDPASFWKTIYSWVVSRGHVYLISPGEERSMALTADMAAPPTRLEILSPNDVTIKKEKGKRKKYTMDSEDGQKREWEVTEPYGFHSGILHIWEWSPYGEENIKGRLYAAGQSAEAHAMGGAWNKSLVANAGRPSGNLSINVDADTTSLTQEEMNAMLDRITEQLEGPANAGKTIVSQHSSYERLTMTPVEMDWTQSRIELAREVAYSMGVPAQVVGIPGSDTFRNMELANLALYTQTINPMVREVLSALSHWLLPRYGLDNTMMLDIDEDAMPQMAIRRQTQIQALMMFKEIFTLNEMREIFNKAPVDDKIGGQIWKNSAELPADYILTKTLADIAAGKEPSPNPNPKVSQRDLMDDYQKLKDIFNA